MPLQKRRCDLCPCAGERQTNLAQHGHKHSGGRPKVARKVAARAMDAETWHRDNGHHAASPTRYGGRIDGQLRWQRDADTHGSSEKSCYCQDGTSLLKTLADAFWMQTGGGSFAG